MRGLPCSFRGVGMSSRYSRRRTVGRGGNLQRQAAVKVDLSNTPGRSKRGVHCIRYRQHVARTWYQLPTATAATAKVVHSDGFKRRRNIKTVRLPTYSAYQVPGTRS